MQVVKIDPSSMVNGDGCRLVVWFAGCSLNCDGCQNKEMQDFSYGRNVSYKKLAQIINNYMKEYKLLDGITLSGGNPQEQVNLTKFLKRIKKLNKDLNIWMWTGYTWEYIQNHPELKEHLEYIDTIITGPFIKERQCESQYYGSSNQEVWRKDKDGNWKRD